MKPEKLLKKYYGSYVWAILGTCIALKYGQGLAVSWWLMAGLLVVPGAALLLLVAVEWVLRRLSK